MFGSSLGSGVAGHKKLGAHVLCAYGAPKVESKVTK